jgi:hypothetical protein
MLRADMDALPVEEATGLPYASKITMKDRDGISGRKQARVGAKTPKCGEWHAKLRFSLLMRFVSYAARDVIYADMDN